MRTCSRLLSLLILALLMQGCDFVYSVQPIGTEIVDLTEIKGALEGGWIGHDKLYTISVTDPANGVLQIGSFRAVKGGALRSEVMTVLRKVGGHLFANFKDPDSPGSGWAFVRIIGTDERQLLAVLPDDKKWQALVRNRTLPGRVTTVQMGRRTETRAILDGLSPEDLQYIADEDRSSLYDWKKPAVFTKVTK